MIQEQFNFHNYDNLIPNLNKTDPRLQKNEDKLNGIMVANTAASQGDLNEIKGLHAKGINLNDADYDDSDVSGDGDAQEEKDIRCKLLLETLTFLQFCTRIVLYRL